MIETISRAPIAPSATRFCRGEVRIEAAVEPDHQGWVGLLDNFEAGANAPDGEVDRLFAKYRLLSARGVLNKVGVGVGWRADGDRVDLVEARISSIDADFARVAAASAWAAAGSASATSAT